MIDAFGNDLIALRELYNGSGNTFDQSVLDKPIAVGSGEVSASLGNKYALAPSADLSVFPAHIRNMAAVRAAYWAWTYGAKGAAMPPQLQSAVDSINATLERVEDGKKGIGENKAPPPRITEYMGDITQGGRVNRMTVNGFRRW